MSQSFVIANSESMRIVFLPEHENTVETFDYNTLRKIHEMHLNADFANCFHSLHQRDDANFVTCQELASRMSRMRRMASVNILLRNLNILKLNKDAHLKGSYFITGAAPYCIVPIRRRILRVHSTIFAG